MTLFEFPPKEKKSHLFEKLGQEYSERLGKKGKLIKDAIKIWLPLQVSGTQYNSGPLERCVGHTQ